MKFLKHTIVFGITLICFGCQESKKETIEPVGTSPDTPVIDTSIERGSYLVTLMDCNTCHTPNVMSANGPQPDLSKRLSGYPSDRPVPTYDNAIAEKGVLFYHPDLTASAGPWGISFAANITPDDSGIGTWSLEQFDLAMRKGKHKGLEGGRMLLPPMPWQSYGSLSDADLEAIFNYLKSIEPIENVVPGPLSP